MDILVTACCILALAASVGLAVYLAGYRRGGASTRRHAHGQWLSIDYFAYSSRLRRWNAGFKVAFALVMILLAILLNNAWVSLAILLAMAGLVIVVGGLSLHDYLKVLVTPMTFLLLSILAIVVDFSTHPAGEYRLFVGLGYLYTTTAMLRSGAVLMLRIIAAISALQMMILTTPSTELISVLRCARVPKGFLDLMNMIYRYIFILLEVFAKMRDAAQSRLGYRDFATSCTTFGSVAGNLLVVSLKKAGAYYAAMESRCYEGELRFLQEEKKLELGPVVLAAAFAVFLLLLWLGTGRAEGL